MTTFLKNISQLWNLSDSFAVESKENLDTVLPQPVFPTTTVFVVYTILIPVLMVVGNVGNILTAIVLWSKQMASTTNLFLRALVLSDIGIISCHFTFISLPGYIAMFINYDLGNNVLMPIGLFVGGFCVMAIQMCNEYILVFVSVERYVAICHPLKYAYLHTRSKVLVSISINVLFSLLYNIPVLLALELHQSPCHDVKSSQHCLTLFWTQFGITSFYQDVYKLWLYTIIYFAIPLTLLFTLNVLILKELKRMQIRRKHLGTVTRAMREKVNITKTIVLIIAVFAIVQTFGLVSQLLLWLKKDSGFDIGSIVNFLYVINSSVNFIIYIAVGKLFRKNFLSVFSKCRC